MTTFPFIWTICVFHTHYDIFLMPCSIHRELDLKCKRCFFQQIFTNWNRGEPNNAGNEDCAEFYGSGGARGKWNDIPCTHSKRYICKKLTCMLRFILSWCNHAAHRSLATGCYML